MKDFEFVLKDNNQKTHKLFFWFLFFLHTAALCLVMLYYYKSSKSIDKLSIGILIFYAVFIALYFYFKNKKYDLTRYIFIPGMAYAVFWINQIDYWTAIIPVAIIIFAKILQSKKNTVVFSNNAATIKSILSEKKYSWDEIDNVVLKDDVLTIDFKSNKLLQAEVIEKDANVVESFNAFALSKINQEYINAKET